jgi:DNA-binding NtrC family response regulator
VARKKIILVEDELPLLRLVEKYLSRMGFDVETYSTSAGALRSFEAAPSNYDLVVADLGIPDMPGDVLLTRMLALRADLKVLVCSGSPFFIEKLPESLRRQVVFLQKPFAPKMLAEAVEGLIASPKNDLSASD